MQIVLSAMRKINMMVTDFIATSDTPVSECIIFNHPVYILPVAILGINSKDF